MNSIIKDIKISSDQSKILIPISDIHVGHIDHDKKLFNNMITWIKEKCAYVILLGDLIDGIAQKDRRYENSSIADEFKPFLDNLHYKQTDVIVESLIPIKKQILGIMAGNHEVVVKKMFAYDATSVIAQRLNIPILTDPGYLVLRFIDGKSSVLYNIFCSHGDWMGGRKRGTKINNMEDKMADFDFDMLLAGHTHDKFVSTRKHIGIDRRGRVIKSKKFFINTGSFIETYTDGNHDGWASRKVFSPQSTGVVRVDFYLKRRAPGGIRYIDCHTRL